MKKILPPLLFIIFAILIPITDLIFGSVNHIPYPNNLFGLPLFLFGLGISIVGKKMFIRLGTNVNTFDEPDLLVTEGLYSFTRNPMYLGFVIALTGIAIICKGSPASLLIILIFLLITDRWYIKFEERMMEKKFGEKYEKYRRKTRRWI